MIERFKNFDKERDLHFMSLANESSKRAGAEGYLPFGALVVDADGNIVVDETCLIKDDRSDATAHAETTCARVASQKYDSDFLWNCTLYTPFEPCAMCTGAIYWSNIGRIVYGLSETRLQEAGSDAQEGCDEEEFSGQTETFNIPCRDVVKGGQKDIVVAGPIIPEGSELETDIVGVMNTCWNK